MVSVLNNSQNEYRCAPIARTGATDAESGGSEPNIHVDEGRSSGFLSGLPTTEQSYSPQQAATKNLKELIEQKHYQGNFESAIRFVASQRIPELSQIKTLHQFYFYVDRLVTWIPEIRHWTIDGNIMHERTVYLRIVQFYYYFNLRELDYLQSPIAPVEGKQLTPLSAWLRDFAVEWGRFLDTSESAKLLSSFKEAPEYNYQDYQKDPEEYATFNEFFARQFSDIDTLRPVAQRNDDRVIVFPAESTFVGQWTVSTTTKHPSENPPSIVVKHIEWTIKELLNDSVHSAAFEGGKFCHSFLNTYDYHRLHTPVAGKVVEARFIPGQTYLEVELKQQGAVMPNGDLANAVIPKRYLDADDPTGYQFVQCRGLIVIETEHFGKVAVLPMGMAQVSSVVFTGPGPTHTPFLLTKNESDKRSYSQQVELLNQKIATQVDAGWTVDKGDMFSYFQFGGSDCVVVFERQANVNITAQVGVHYPIRSQYGVANFD